MLQQSEEIVDSDVDIMMCTDNETGKMSTKEISFTRAHTGFFFKEDKTVSIKMVLCANVSLQQSVTHPPVYQGLQCQDVV